MYKPEYLENQWKRTADILSKFLEIDEQHQSESNRGLQAARANVVTFLVSKFNTIQVILEREFPILQSLRLQLGDKTDYRYPTKLVQLCYSDPDIKGYAFKASKRLPTTANEVLQVTAFGIEFVLAVLTKLQGVVNVKHLLKELQEDTETETGEPKFYSDIAKVIIESRATRLAKLFWIVLDIIQFILLYNGIEAYRRFEKNLSIAIQRRFGNRFSAQYG